MSHFIFGSFSTVELNMLFVFYVFFFFFQAEDGIRDLIVTGVQTCALPISTKDHAIVLPKIPFPEPVITEAIEVKQRGEEEKLSNGLHKLHEEDPTFQHERSEEHTSELQSRSDLVCRLLLEKKRTRARQSDT